jgi:hypothetical protein
VKDLCIWLVAIVMLLFASRYAYQIWKREIRPTLSTWIIFLLGTGLSLVTYAVAENRDFRSGILNAMDVAVVVVVLVATLIWSRGDIRFKSFEKWYLGGIAMIVAYGILSGDAWGSNIFTQILISVGYIPTAQNLLTEKRNTESFSGWGLGLLAGLIAIYPSIADGNALAALYAIRTVVMTSSILGIMAYYEFRQAKINSH